MLFMQSIKQLIFEQRLLQGNKQLAEWRSSPGDASGGQGELGGSIHLAVTSFGLR